MKSDGQTLVAGDPISTSTVAATGMSSKKRKRLDKYIEKKLRKEESVELMKKLATSSMQSTLLRSSKTFGSKESSRQKLKRALALESAGLDTSDIDVVLHREVRDADRDEDIMDNIGDDTLDVLPPVPYAAPKPFVIEIPKAMKPKPVDGVDLAPLNAKSEISCKPAFYVTVSRTPSVQESRLRLPVVAEEQQIMEAIKENAIVIISGETGSGKTTQIPQFLFEAGYGHPSSENPGMIGVTQPRRVAAVSMAQRVRAELNVAEKEVSYQIRYDTTVTRETKIKFMTDGVLLKEISSDFLLTKYSCLIIDEAHERSLNTDILIGLLSRIVVLRNNHAEKAAAKSGKDVKPLKLVIMSATLRVEDFTMNTKLFTSPPPCIHISARQHPVTVHFNRHTADNYVMEAFKKVCKIHQKLPPGNILVFLTGQGEITDLCRRLNKTFEKREPRARISGSSSNSVQKLNQEGGGPVSETEFLDAFDDFKASIGGSADTIEDNYDDMNFSENEEDETEFMKGIDADFVPTNCGPLLVLPLHSAMNPEDQMRIFQPTADGTRVCIVATNVAETSLTIPGIKYVIDSGRVKQRSFDANGVSAFDIGWVSKASADQRMGRAGRTGPGHCYRLYSGALFHNQFEQFSQPEIARTPIEGVMLQMKDMNIDHVINFPFVTPPTHIKMITAERILKHLKALDKDGHITADGRAMASIPVAPRFSKMLLAGQRNNCLAYALTMVAALSVGDPFLRAVSTKNEDDEDLSEEKAANNSLGNSHRLFAEGLDSDIVKYVRVYGAWMASSDKKSFAAKYGLSNKAMNEIMMLREQLVSLIQQSSKFELPESHFRMKPLDKDIIGRLKLVVLAGFIDQVAVMRDCKGNNEHSKPLYDLVFAPTAFNADLKDGVQVHPSSCLASKESAFIVYQELIRTTNGAIRMKGVTAIHPSWISQAASDLCTFSRPLENPSPFYDSISGKIMCSVIPRFGANNIDLPVTQMEHPSGAEKSRHFLRALLEGLILPGFSKFTNLWLTKPSIFTSKNIPVTHSKIFPLVQMLVQSKIETKADLLMKWKSEPTFLLSALLTWLSTSDQPKLRAIWPLAN